MHNKIIFIIRLISAVGGVETLDKPAAEKCSKQCDQANCLDQPSDNINPPVNNLDQSANHIVKNDPVLVQYNQDILASFQEAVEVEDSSNSENVPTECTKPSLSVQTSPLPDVVGEATTCSSEISPVVNSVLCERLEGVSLNPNAVVMNENMSGDTTILASNCSNAETNGLSEPTINQQLSTPKCPVSQVETVLNGGDLTNSVPLVPLLKKLTTQTPESQKSSVKDNSTKINGSGKKTKVGYLHIIGCQSALTRSNASCNCSQIGH